MAAKQLECPVLRPTYEQVLSMSFEEYIAKHEKKIAEAGVAKIVAPAAWVPRKSGYESLESTVPTIQRPIRQHATGTKGLYRMIMVEQKPTPIAQFQADAMDKANLPTGRGDDKDKELSDGDYERKFWQNIGISPPLYGADVPGSLCDERCKGWNLRRLDTLLSSVLKENGFSLPGVNEPYLYFGQWRSVFAWHTEDLDLYSVNYLHFGAAKQWYVVPPEHRARFETMVKGVLPEMFKQCPEFLRHKELLISPQLLDQYQIPYVRVVQHPREFIINYPGAYHAGFNRGYNCAESVNFATKRWIPIGARAGVCRCNPDSVKIDMRLFRHLVPAKLLPAELLHDTSEEESEEEEEEEEDDSSDDGEEESEEAEEEESEEEGASDNTRSHAHKGHAAASVARGRKRVAAEDEGATKPQARKRGASSAAKAPAPKRRKPSKGGATPAPAPKKPRATSTAKRAEKAAAELVRASRKSLNRGVPAVSGGRVMGGGARGMGGRTMAPATAASAANGDHHAADGTTIKQRASAGPYAARRPVSLTGAGGVPAASGRGRRVAVAVVPGPEDEGGVQGPGLPAPEAPGSLRPRRQGAGINSWIHSEEFALADEIEGSGALNARLPASTGPAAHRRRAQSSSGGGGGGGGGSLSSADDDSEDGGEGGHGSRRDHSGRKVQAAAEQAAGLPSVPRTLAPAAAANLIAAALKTGVQRVAATMAAAVGGPPGKEGDVQAGGEAEEGQRSRRQVKLTWKLLGE